MSRSDAPRVIARQWFVWLAVLGVTTAALVAVRGEIEQSHVALTLLLVVLGASAAGGRAFGYLMALLGFLIIDYYFQAPYGFLSVGKALDWLVLTAFVASAFVATELLSRARAETEKARQRTDEVASLYRLGSETLRYADPDEAVMALTEVIRATLDAQWCTIRCVPSTGGRDEWSSTKSTADGRTVRDRHKMDDRVARAFRDAESASPSHLLLASTDGAVALDPLESGERRVESRCLGLPLMIESRLAGVLIVGSDASTPITLDSSRRRFVATISYYAALGVERVRLAAEAEQARELREVNRTKDEVLATVSHDLLTPLTSIKLLANDLARHGERKAAAIEEHADRLAHLVISVLDLSRIRAGGVVLEPDLNTAEDLVAAAVQRAEGSGAERVIARSVDVNQPVQIARFDFVHTLRILGNLIDNALRYSPPESLVEIFTEREGEWLVISVADRGVGVRPEERARIFDAFYRPSSEMPDVGRAGLGLSIAARLAELQGGSVEYAAREHGGSIFTLRLPAVDCLPPPVAYADATTGRTSLRGEVLEVEALPSAAQMPR